MCGITGVFNCQDNRDIDLSVISAMNDSLLHRGPDESGIFRAPGVALGHQRLSIIDLKSGQQPMFNHEKTLGVVYNGEIYNFQPLKQTLINKGYRFQTHSDTEVLLHGYAAWGENLVDHLRGMFAFCIFDVREQTLFLARDRIGIKPLYYAYLSTGEFVFGSELKALMKHPHFVKDMNLQAVSDYFALGYIPDPKTIFNRVYKLSPGHKLTVVKGKGEVKQIPYWHLKAPNTIITDEREAIEALLEKIQECVEIRMISEVPLGAFLSGGVDSSVVVNTMANLSNNPITTCSIGFQEKNFDESIYSAQVAAQFQTDHHMNEVSMLEEGMIQTLAGIYDEPFSDSSSLPTLKVCEAARKHVTVALSGDGGDEVFAGYRRYRGHLFEERFRHCIPPVIRRTFFRPLAAMYPAFKSAPRFFRAKATLQMLCYQAIEGYFNNVCLFKEQERSKLFSNRFKKNLDGYHPLSVFEKHAQQAPKDDPLSLIQYLDLKTYLPGDILTKVDRASMHHSLEVRVPLLDHTLVEWSLGLANSLKLNKGSGKYVLKKSYENSLSRDLMYRKKQGFAVPLSSWFRGPLRSKALSLINSQTLLESQIMDMSYITRLVNAHLSRQADHSAQIWTLCMFESFIKNIMNDQKGTKYARVACA